VESYKRFAEGKIGGGGDHAHEPATGQSDGTGSICVTEDENRNAFVEELGKVFSQT
jgi:hypothetical protein